MSPCDFAKEKKNPPFTFKLRETWIHLFSFTRTTFIFFLKLSFVALEAAVLQFDFNELLSALQLNDSTAYTVAVLYITKNKKEHLRGCCLSTSGKEVMFFFPTSISEWIFHTTWWKSGTWSKKERIQGPIWISVNDKRLESCFLQLIQKKPNLVHLMRAVFF